MAWCILFFHLPYNHHHILLLLNISMNLCDTFSLFFLVTPYLVQSFSQFLHPFVSKVEHLHFTQQIYKVQLNLSSCFKDNTFAFALITLRLMLISSIVTYLLSLPSDFVLFASLLSIASWVATALVTFNICYLYWEGFPVNCYSPCPLNSPCLYPSSNCVHHFIIWCICPILHIDLSTFHLIVAWSFNWTCNILSKCYF